LEKGMGKSFLQTNAAGYLRTVLDSNPSALQSMDVQGQSEVMSFLESSKDYAPAGGEIVGVLKTMKDNFNDSLGGAVEDEEKAVGAFKKLKGSLQDLIATNSAAIESKTELAGQVAVQLVQKKALVTQTEDQLGDDLATAAELQKACEGQDEAFKVRQADAAAEVEAIGQAIGVLNNDDATALFSKTDTRPAEEAAPALLQVSIKKNSPKAVALEALRQVRRSDNKAITMLAFSAKQALKSGAVDFGKIMKMIDDMIVLLKEEYKTDLSTRDECNADLNKSATDSKDVARAVKGLEAKVEELTESIAQATEVVAKSAQEVKDSEQTMAEATDQRKKENAEFTIAVDMNNQAVKLVMLAKDKLNAFYNPDLVTPTDAPVEGEALIQALPEGAPEMKMGKKKSSGGVTQLMDNLANDLNNDTASLEKDEAVAQSEYESLSKDLAQQIKDSLKDGVTAAEQKASGEADLLAAEDGLTLKTQEKASVAQTITDLHAKCDFLLENFEDRASKREGEISGLQKAKTVLS